MRLLRRTSPWLVALLAMAMQAALGAAQVHALVHAHAHAPGGARTWTKGAALACRAVVKIPACAPAVPHDHRHDCPTCWSLATAGSGVLPAPALPALHAPPLAAPAPVLAQLAPPAKGFANFRARAPPSV